MRTCPDLTPPVRGGAANAADLHGHLRHRLPAGDHPGRAAARAQAPGRRLAAQGRRQGRRLRRCSGRASPTRTATRCRSTSSRRPSAAGDGYDPTATSASNLGPESIVDTLPDPAVKGDTGTQQPAHPGVLPQPRDRQAGRRRRLPAVLHTGRGGRGARGLLVRARLPRPRHPRRQHQPGLPDAAVPDDLQGRHGRVREIRRGLREGPDRADPGRRAGAPCGAVRRGHRLRIRP